MNRPRTHASLALAALVLLVGKATRADEPAGETPRVAGASDEGQRAIAKFRVPQGFKVELFAAEPLLANPVAFGLDARNRVYVAESFRVHKGVTDNRGHMKWLDEDLANRTTADRLAMYRKDAGAKFRAEYGTQPDRIKFVEDRDGDGKADHAEVFAGGFNAPEDGIGSAVLIRGKDVWYTSIPHLWHLRDEDGDGKADSRESLHEGYGVHVALLGHDLHGLTWGPDGRIYFSVGDRGANLKLADGRTITNLESGSVFRCEPDGSKLELFATGLRNPQDLVFNELGDLFSVDNNSDSGDRARVVNILEGSDSGWRIGFQYIESPVSRGPWNAEKLWHPRHEGQPAFLLPPLANLSDGPSGLAVDPGTGFPEAYRKHFFLADFRGTSGSSGVRSFALEPDGASYKLADAKEFLWSILATDCDFGTDGALYVSDWVEGWNGDGKGRIYKVVPETVDPRVVEVKTLVAEGFDQRPVAELAKLLGHADWRVRQGAQFALAAKGAEGLDPLIEAARSGRTSLARIHAIWGLGLVPRTNQLRGLDAVMSLAVDPEPEVRAQAIRAVCDAREWPEPGQAQVDQKIDTRNHNPLRTRQAKRTRPEGGESWTQWCSRIAQVTIPGLGDPSPRVRMFAALGLGRLASKGLNPEDCRQAVAPLVAMLRADGNDPVLRHAAVMGLVGLDEPAETLKFAADESPGARMGVLLTLRHWKAKATARASDANDQAILGGLAQFLEDTDPAIAVEAARAINDAPAEGAMPALAAKLKAGLPEPLLRRAINANLRVGGSPAAEGLARFAGSDAPGSLRVEALEALASWPKPSGRDRVLGLWRPVTPHPIEEAAGALRPVVATLLSSAPDRVRAEAAEAAGALGIKEAGPALVALVADSGRRGETRVAAIRALDALGDSRLAEAVRVAVKAKDGTLRVEGQRLLAKLDPADAVGVLEEGLNGESLAERQGALATLGGLNHPKADALLGAWVDRLIAGQVPAEVQLDMIEAAGRRSDPAIKEKLAKYESGRSADDPLAPYRESLAGGNAERGRKVFTTKAEVECVRCHRVRAKTGEGVGGDVGPDLTGVGGRNPREYLLESIVAPNRQIAKGFETAVVALDDGRTVAGIVKADDGKRLKLQSPDGKFVEVDVASIEERKTGLSGMPQDLVKKLSKAEIRDLVEFLATLKEE